MNHSIRVIIGTVLCALCACGNDYEKQAIEADNYWAGREAVENITNQESLSRIALHAHDELVQRDAVDRINDEKALAEVLYKSNSHLCKMGAVHKIYNDSVLVDMAFSDILELRCAAINRLQDQARRSKIVSAPVDARLIGIWLLINEFNRVQPENNDKQIGSVIPVIQLLTDPAVTDRFGALTEVKLQWHLIHELYSRENAVESDGVDTVWGEWLQCKFTLKRRVVPHILSWSTDFPLKAYDTRFLAAEIDLPKCLDEIIRSLPRAVLAGLSTRRINKEINWALERNKKR